MDAEQVNPSRWLDALEARLPRHAALLRRLLAGVAADARVVQVSVSCSLARGAADEWSDVDAEISLEPAAWPAGLELVEPLVRRAGDVVDLLHHAYAGAGTATSRRTAVLYRDGVQLDLMVWPVSVWSGMAPPDSVVLHATRQVFTTPWDPARARATAESEHEWRLLAWWALLDAAKYLRRSSPWEARERLEEARAHLLRLWAARQGVPFPQYGITALLDSEAATLPPGLDDTVAASHDDLARAVLACADLLRDSRDGSHESWASTRLRTMLSP